MKLTPSDPRLVEICRRVEQRLANVEYLKDVELAVELRANFEGMPYPVSARDPTVCDPENETILVNEPVFFSREQDVNEFALAHEVGHYVRESDVRCSAPGLKNVHGCTVGDWFAAKWGLSAELRKERLDDRGEEYCSTLPHLDTDEAFLRWVTNWLVRYRIAKLERKSLP